MCKNKQNNTQRLNAFQHCVFNTRPNNATSRLTEAVCNGQRAYRVHAKQQTGTWYNDPMANGDLLRS